MRKARGVRESEEGRWPPHGLQKGPGGKNKMAEESLNGRILSLLAAERSLYGHGSAAVIDHRLGKSKGYVRRLLRGEIGLQVEMLDRLLEVLEVDPVDFLTRAVGTRLVPTRLLRRLERQHAAGRGRPLLDRVMLTRLERWVAQLPPTPPDHELSTPRPRRPTTAAAHELARLEERLFCEPESGAEAIGRRFVECWMVVHRQARVPAGDRLLLARWLGLVGSAQRLREDFHGAAVCLRLALDLLTAPPTTGSPAAKVEVLQRLASLLVCQGDLAVAELLLHQAMECAVLGSSVSVSPALGMVCSPLLGRLLVQGGGLALRRGEPRRARQVLTAGLAHLGTEGGVACPWGFTAELGRVRALLQESVAEPVVDWRPIEHALERARQSSPFRRGADHPYTGHRSADEQGPGRWSLHRLEGLVAWRRRDWATAEKALRVAAVGWRQEGWQVDEMLTHLDLAEVLWRTARFEGLRRHLGRCFDWIEPLRHAPASLEALRNLTRATLTGDVEPVLLSRVRLAIERECGDSSYWVQGWMP